MNKYLLIGILTISTLTFSSSEHYSEYKTHKYCFSANYHKNSYNNCINLTPSQEKLINDYLLEIDKKKLELNKIWNSEDIDWDKIEQINKKIVDIKTKIMKIKDTSLN